METYEEILGRMQGTFGELAGYPADDASDIGIRLRVPLGQFALQPALGSRLYTLRPETEDKDANALAMAQDALRELPQVWVESAVCSGTEPLIARIPLPWEGGGAESGGTCDGDK